MTSTELSNKEISDKLNVSIHAINSIGKQFEGIGDKVEKFTKATGIKKVVEKVAEMVHIDDCGCMGRKELLNTFGLRLKREPTESHIKTLKDFYTSHKNTGGMNIQDFEGVYRVREYVFSLRRSPLPCPTCKGASKVYGRMFVQMESILKTFG